MPEWWHTLWSYRLDDLLMFSPRAHARLFELVNRETWPAALVAAAMPALLAASLLSRRGRAEALALMLLAAASAVMAELHLRQSLAGLTDVAWPWAVAFGLQALAAAGLAFRSWRHAAAPVPAGTRSPAGKPAARALAGVLAGLALAWPLTAALLGRPFWQAEVFGLAPDPTVLGWLAWATLSTLPRRVWLAFAALPLAWCAFAGLMGAAMESPLAAVMPAAGVAVLVMRWGPFRRAQPAGRRRA